MTGIVIFTAGREDAYQDYLNSVKNGIEIGDVQSHLSEEQIRTLTESGETDVVRLWGTTVQSQWQKIEKGDIVLVYRDRKLISRARALLTKESLSLADDLWNYGNNPWDEQNPWKYLVFVDEFEEIEVSIEDFNSLVGYDDEYIPQGFMRVADKRIRRILKTHESVENAIADLTGTGERIHEVESEDNESTSDSLDQFKQILQAAGEDGSRNEEFERLIAEAFTRLGCTAHWVEGGGDTDVEITAPAKVIVEAKSRGSSNGVRSLNATRIASHRDRRGADHAIVVCRHFPPSTIEDAERNNITTLTIDQLGELLDRRAAYGLPPEKIFEYLLEPGAFQEDRLDLLDEQIDERRAAVTTLFDVLHGIERSDEPIEAEQLRYILYGMSDSGYVPSEDVLAHSLQFLAHPALGLLEKDEEGYMQSTSVENAIEVIQSLGTLIGEVHDGFDLD